MNNGNPALVMRLRGGLGNQLFQYASARAITLRNGANLYLDTESGYARDPYHRKYSLGGFPIAATPLKSAEALTLTPRSLWTEYHWRREIFRIRWMGHWHDPSLHNLRIRKPVQLDAYLQSPLYFEECAATIRAELAFTPQNIPRDELSLISAGESVCVHARRNLALTASGAQQADRYFGAYSTSYYQKSIEALRAEHPVARFFFFGDDHEWIRRELMPLCSDGTIINTGSDLQDFWLMTKCSQFIIANSTFSWWAAWLGAKPDSVVCCGTSWNQGERFSPKNLIPVSWRRVACPA